MYNNRKFRIQKKHVHIFCFHSTFFEFSMTNAFETNSLHRTAISHI